MRLPGNEVPASSPCNWHGPRFLAVMCHSNSPALRIGSIPRNFLGDRNKWLSQVARISAVRKRRGHRLLGFSSLIRTGTRDCAWNSPVRSGRSQTSPFPDVRWAIIVAARNQPKTRQLIVIETMANGDLDADVIPTMTQKNAARKAIKFPFATVVPDLVGEMRSILNGLSVRHFGAFDDSPDNFLLPLSGVHGFGGGRVWRHSVWQDVRRKLFDVVGDHIRTIL